MACEHRICRYDFSPAINIPQRFLLARFHKDMLAITINVRDVRKAF
jgi:hypothetical protein